MRWSKNRARKAACGRGDCGVSTGIHGGLTFGFGHLDHNGFWEQECEPCTKQESLRVSNASKRDANPALYDNSEMATD